MHFERKGKAALFQEILFFSLILPARTFPNNTIVNLIDAAYYFTSEGCQKMRLKG
jgi:hypothetical protein